MTEAEFLALPIDQQVRKWEEAVKFARQWALIELTMRNAIFKTQFAAPKPGTNKTRPTGLLNADGEQLAIVGDHKINLSLDKEGWLAAVKAKLISDKLADSVVSWSPKVKDAAYRKLDADDMKKVAPFVTEKPGTPGLEIKIASTLRW